MKITLLLLILTVCTFQAYPFNSAYLGVYIEDISTAEKDNLKINQGVKVEEIVANSPAERSGIKPGDILLTIDRQAITDSEKLFQIINSCKPGDKVTVEVLSVGKKRQITVVLDKKSDILLPDINIVNPKTRHLGIKLQRMTDQLKDHFSVDNGALVAEIITDSPAKKAGLQAGDIILEAEGHTINSSTDLQQVIKDRKPGDSVALQLKRRDDYLTIEVEVEESAYLFSIDMNEQVIILGKNTVIDISGISRLFNDVVPDSTKNEIQKQLDKMQSELDRLKKRLSQ